MSLDFERGVGGSGVIGEKGWGGIGRTIWRKPMLIHVFLLFFILLRFIDFIYEKLKGEGVEHAYPPPLDSQ